jgi:hypothetical protein
MKNNRHHVYNLNYNYASIGGILGFTMSKNI